MTLPPTMMAFATEGTLPLSFRPNGTLYVDPDHLESSKCWIRNLTSSPNSTFKPPGTPSYVQKHVANQTSSAAMLSFHHGTPELANLWVAICEAIQIEITQFAKDMAKQLFPLMTQQYTDPTTMTATAMMMPMPMTLLPMTALHHSHCDPVNLAIPHKIKPELVQCITTSPANAEDPDTTTAPATPPMATLLMTTMMPTWSIVANDTYPPTCLTPTTTTPSVIPKTPTPQWTSPQPYPQHPQWQCHWWWWWQWQQQWWCPQHSWLLWPKSPNQLSSHPQPQSQTPSLKPSSTQWLPLPG